MCTLTFIPRKKGYALAMNRDEQRTRETALPPLVRLVNGSAVIHPMERSGGTWIAVNQRAAGFALLNWYSVSARVKTHPVSRGEIVLAVAAADSAGAVAAILRQLSLDQFNPFRLIGVFPDQNRICEWRWDLKRLARQNHSWAMHQWASSGFDEPQAQAVRARTFHARRRLKSAGRLEWLRRLHGSHSPESGPFSTCMHRDDAATVSYTEVTAASGRATMRYHAGAPCEKKELFTASLPLIGIRR
jgi:hypothetical protein